MAFNPKEWKDAPDPTTPIDAAALADVEKRLSDYTDTQVAAGGGGGGGPVADASAAVKGVSKLSVDPAVAANPVAVGDNDPRLAPVTPGSIGAATAADLAAETAARTAADATKQDAATAATDAELAAHTNRTDNPHAVTKAQVGLANVDNTTDATKPVSAAQAAALATKQDAATAATDAELAAEAAARDAAIATHAGLKRGVHGIPATVAQGDSLVGDGAGGFTTSPPAMGSIARIDGCSHSGMIGGYTGGSDNSYFKRLAKMLGARKCGWLSAGGSVACWPTANAGTDGGYSWVFNMFRPPSDSDADGNYSPHTNVAVIHHGAEDLLTLGSQNLKAYQEAVKSEASRYCAATLYEAEADPAIVSPLATGVASAGGTLAAGSYFYKIDAYGPNGESGPNPGETAVAGVAANSKIKLTWTVASGATGYRIYRGTASGGENTLVADVPAAQFVNGNPPTWTDDGTAAGVAQSPAYGANAPRHWTFGSAIQTIASGSWQYSGGGVKWCQVAAGGPTPLTQWAQFTTDPDYPGNLIVALTLNVIPGTVGAGASMTLGVTVDGVAQPDVVLNFDKGGHADAESGKQNAVTLRFGRADCGLGIPLANPGVHTIKLAIKAVAPAGTTPYFIVDEGHIEADPLDGPVLMWPSGFWKLPDYTGKFTVAQGWKHGADAGTDPLNDAAVDALIVAQKAAMADFPGRSVYVDVDGAIAKNMKYLHNDGVHPNNLGHALIALLHVDALRRSGLLTARVLAAVGQKVLGAFDGGVWRTIGGVFGTGANQRPLLNTWAAFSTTSTFPSYMVGRLDGRSRARGWLKQAGAGAVGSTMFQNDVGESPSSLQNPHDQAMPVYNGAAWQIASYRVDTEAGTPPRGVSSLFNGSVAAGSAMSLNGLEWAAEA